MARKVKDVTITAAGRDNGKCFRLTEVPATQAEKWGMRAFLALARSGVEVPDNLAAAGLPGLAAVGFRAFTMMSFADAEPLLDEMFGCITRVVDPAKPIYARVLAEDDIEEVATRVFLRGEVIELHTGFSPAAAFPTLEAAA